MSKLNNSHNCYTVSCWDLQGVLAAEGAGVHSPPLHVVSNRVVVLLVVITVCSFLLFCCDD